VKILSQLFLAMVLVVMLAPTQTSAQFHKSGQWIGAHLVLATDPIGFGANYEYAIEENMGIGGILRYWGGGFSSGGIDVDWTVIMPQAIFNYHFQPREKVDPYVGARLGFAIYNSTWTSADRQLEHYSDSQSGGLFLTAAGGARYFFTPQISGHAAIEFRVAGEDYFDSAIILHLGADFTLK
jgi:Outer membrane protein beta-barrel domain